MKQLFKNIIIAFLVFLTIAGLFALFNGAAEKPAKISLTQLVERINQEEISTITIKGDTLEIELKDGLFEEATKERESSLTESLKNYGLEPAKLRLINLEVQGESGAAFWLGVILPFLFPLILIGFFFWFMFRGAQRGQSQAFTFGRSKARLVRPETE